MTVKIKSNINTKRLMSDIKKQAEKSLKAETFDIECPHCKKNFSAHSGKNKCPHCDNNVTLDLNIKL